MNLQTLRGSLRGEQLTRRGNCLIYAINSVGCDTFGLVKDLHHIYLHETAYSRRKRLFRAVAKGRDALGTLIALAPPEDEDNALYLIACVTQFGWGEALEDNTRAREGVNSLNDRHYVAGLRADTKSNRRQYFKTCLKKLATLVMGHKDVESVYFPEGIGCRG